MIRAVRFAPSSVSRSSRRRARRSSGIAATCKGLDAAAGRGNLSHARAHRGRARAGPDGAVGLARGAAAEAVGASAGNRGMRRSGKHRDGAKPRGARRGDRSGRGTSRPLMLALSVRRFSSRDASRTPARLIGWTLVEFLRERGFSRRTPSRCACCSRRPMHMTTRSRLSRRIVRRPYYAAARQFLRVDRADLRCRGGGLRSIPRGDSRPPPRPSTLDSARSPRRRRSRRHRRCRERRRRGELGRARRRRRGGRGADARDGSPQTSLSDRRRRRTRNRTLQRSSLDECALRGEPGVASHY